MIYRTFLNGEKLPKPLSQETTEYYFELYKNGDMNAREILIKHNLRLVINVVCEKFYTTKYEMDDLTSIGVIGLIKAIDSFNIDKNRTLSTYATRCIINEILVYMRNNKKHEDISSLDESKSDDNEEYSQSIKDTLIDYKTDIEEDIFNLEFRTNFIKFIKNILSEKEFNVVYMYFGFFGNKKYLQEEISKILGMTRPNVSKILSRSLNKIKNKLILEIENTSDINNWLGTLNEVICFDGTIKNSSRKLMK